MTGDRTKALSILSELHSAAGQQPISPYNEALIYDGLGEKEEAISRLERMFAVTSQRFGLKTDPTWDNLRSHPRFQELLERIESK